jgi:multisubunit Na+/H+ antiporter MnhF subunit
VAIATRTLWGAVAAGFFAISAPVISFIVGGAVSDRLIGADDRSAAKSLLLFMSVWLLTNVGMALALLLLVLSTQRTALW